MAKRSRNSMLGIELSSNEIRIVETMSTGSKPVVVAMGASPMPPGCVEGGRITKIDTVALTVRRVLESMGATSTRAVISVPSEGVICRSFNMPPVPADELRGLVEGEVRHYQVLRSMGGVFDFFQLDGSLKPTPENSVVVVGAEEDVTGSLRELATKAGLTVVALEPTWMGAYRGGFIDVADGMCMLVCVLDTSVEVVALKDGKPILYRHLELGMNSFLASAFGGVELAEMEGAATVVEKLPDGKEAHFLKGPLDTLVLELKRSVDFLAREFGDAGRVSDLYLAGTHLSLPALTEPIRSVLGVPINIGRPHGFITGDASTLTVYTEANAHQFLSAYGLSLHGSASADNRVPSVDLAARERVILEQEGERKLLTGSLVASILVVIAAGAGFFLLTRESSNLSARISAAHNRITELEGVAKKSLQQEASKTAQLNAFASKSIELIPLMDILSRSIDSEVGVKQVSIARSSGIRFIGEAPNEAAVVRTVDTIQMNPNVQSVSLANFEKVENETGRAVRYQITVMPMGFGATGATP